MDRRISNPVFNDRKLKLGTFQTNLDSGCVMSDLDGRLDITWPNTLALAQLADEMQFEAIVPVARWRGFGGPSGHNDVTLESLATMSGLAECTRRIRLFGTIHTMAFHPAVAAKMVATMDEISCGRIGVNLEAGSNPIDHGQMGIWHDLSHAELYEVAEEWLTVATRLWTEDHVDFSGKYYQLVDCMSNPKPVQKPRPPILCAATSDTGMRFTITQADASLVNGADVEDLKRNGRRAKDLASAMGRTTKTVGLVMFVPGPTDASAHERVDYYNAGADIEALTARALEYSQGAKDPCS